MSKLNNNIKLNTNYYIQLKYIKKENKKLRRKNEELNAYKITLESHRRIDDAYIKDYTNGIFLLNQELEASSKIMQKPKRTTDNVYIKWFTNKIFLLNQELEELNKITQETHRRIDNEYMEWSTNQSSLLNQVHNKLNIIKKQLAATGCHKLDISL